MAIVLQIRLNSTEILLKYKHKHNIEWKYSLLCGTSFAGKTIALMSIGGHLRKDIGLYIEAL